MDAIVTGAASGLGRAVVEMLLADNFRVLAVDINETALADLSLPDEKLLTIGVDATNPVELAHLASQVGELGALVNAHGVEGMGDIETLSPADWNRVLQVNLTSVYLTIRALLPSLRRARNAAIVNIASVAAFVAFGQNISYSASKSGLVALTRELAVDLAPEGIRVNAVCPGLMDTPMLGRIFSYHQISGVEDPVRRVTQRIPLRRIGTSREVAEVVRFLVSPKASYITGQAIAVDGGYSSW